jgi:hypothetical protein
MIPSTGEPVPVIGPGSWIQFDVADRSAERARLRQALTLMHQYQASLVDSPLMYGRSEQVIGELTNEVGLTDQRNFNETAGVRAF